MINQEQLWNWMWDGKYPPGYPDMDRLWLKPLERRAYATLTEKISYHEPGHFKTRIKKGTRVKVVMVSRMGDIGITTDLTADNGYSFRIQCVDGSFEYNGVSIPIEPENILTNIKLIEDPNAEKMGCKPFEKIK